jgi:type IV secretory pathway VirB4 component
VNHQAHYVITYYGRFMTRNEMAAYRHLQAAMKATHGRSDAAAQQEAQRHRTFSRLTTTDPEILQLTDKGYERFVERTAERILAENENDIFLNFCPRCHELARTPKAQQCRVCGLDWHPAEQTTRED